MRGQSQWVETVVTGLPTIWQRAPAVQIIQKIYSFKSQSIQSILLIRSEWMYLNSSKLPRLPKYLAGEGEGDGGPEDNFFFFILKIKSP